MEVTLQNNNIQIKSLLKDYELSWINNLDDLMLEISKPKAIVVDMNVYKLYKKNIDALEIENIIIQESKEKLKNPNSVLSICSKILNCNFKRGDLLLAIGGGIIQDIVTLAASIIFRGIDWIYCPTTLLAQADSCIGGKSSINFEKWKNQLGNFYPPDHIFIYDGFLNTLSESDIESGIGEIVKVHLLSGYENVKKLESMLCKFKTDKEIRKKCIHNALLLKSKIIQEDEFDTGLRLKMNFGHTFGHALESGMNYTLPHGIAVSWGMLFAVNFSFELNLLKEVDYIFLEELAKKNILMDQIKDINMNSFFDALKHDKKNKNGKYCFILPVSIGEVEVTYIDINQKHDELISLIFSKYEQKK